MAKTPKKPGRIERVIRRAVLGPVEGRRAPGPTDAEIRKLLEQEKGGDSK